MRIVEISFLCTFLIMLFLFSSSNAQINWNIYTEGGYFNSVNGNSSQPNDLLLRLDGNLNYSYSKDNVLAAVKLKVRPEVYGSDNNFRSLKLRASGNYSQANESLNWGVDLAGQRNFYQNKVSDFTYSIFLLTVNSDWHESKDYSVSTQVGFSYQTASENFEQNLDLLFLEAAILKSLFPNNTSGLGIYIERFKIDNKYLSRLTNSASTNKGWRYGPQISFNYFEHGIISLEYRFLLHSSQVTKHPSYEHWIRLVAGMIFSESWSVFLLTDYYDRKFTLNKENPAEEYLIYNPLDAENKVNIKLARELSEVIESYVKVGYFKERFFDSRFNFEGWNILFGIEVGY